MVISEEGVMTYIWIFKVILEVILGTTIFCILINWGASLVDKERKAEREKISSGLLKDWSLENAMKVNRETINRNNYVRAEGKSFFEDIIKETIKEKDENAAEHKLFQLREVIITEN